MLLSWSWGGSHNYSVHTVDTARLPERCCSRSCTTNVSSSIPSFAPQITYLHSHFPLLISTYVQLHSQWALRKELFNDASRVSDLLESLTGTQAPLGSHCTLLWTLPAVSASCYIHLKQQECLYCPIMWYRNGLYTHFRRGKKTGLNPCFCGLNSGWDLSHKPEMVSSLCWAYTWFTVPLGCPILHGLLTMLLSHIRSLPCCSNTAWGILNTRSYKDICRGEHCGCLSYQRDKLQCQLV